MTEKNPDIQPELETPDLSWRSFFRQHILAIIIVTVGFPGVRIARHHCQKWYTDQISQIKHQYATSRRETDQQSSKWWERVGANSEEARSVQSQHILDRIRQAQRQKFFTRCDGLGIEGIAARYPLAVFSYFQARISEDLQHDPDIIALSDRRYFAPGQGYISYALMATWLREYFDGQSWEMEQVTPETMVQLVAHYPFLTYLLPRVPGAGELYLHRMIRSGQREGTVNEQLRQLWFDYSVLPGRDSPERQGLLQRTDLEAWVLHLSVEEQAIVRRVMRSRVPGGSNLVDD